MSVTTALCWHSSKVEYGTNKKPRKAFNGSVQFRLYQVFVFFFRGVTSSLRRPSPVACAGDHAVAFAVNAQMKANEATPGKFRIKFRADKAPNTFHTIATSKLTECNTLWRFQVPFSTKAATLNQSENIFNRKSISSNYYTHPQS